MTQTQQTGQQVRPIPEGFRSVTPHLVCEGAAAALEFYKKAFGAVEISRMPGPDGRIMNAQFRIGDSMLMLNDDMPQYGALGPLALKGTPVVIHLYVPDVDAAFAQAVGAGATAMMPPADQFWGDRYSVVQDPYGHRWSLATHVRDMTPETMKEELDKVIAQRQACAGDQQ